MLPARAWPRSPAGSAGRVVHALAVACWQLELRRAGHATISAFDESLGELRLRVAAVSLETGAVSGGKVVVPNQTDLGLPNMATVEAAICEGVVNKPRGGATRKGGARCEPMSVRR